MPLRLPHLENLLLSISSDKVEEVINSIVEGDNIALKYDGNPAFVCGFDEHGFFLALKSMYYAKDKKVIRLDSDNDIITDEEFRNKLVFIASHLKHLPDNGMPYSGDVIFTNHNDYIETSQPNIVEYVINSSSKLGVVIHSIKNFSADIDGVEFYPSHPIVKFERIPVPKLLKTEPKFRATVIGYFQKYINTYIREFSYDFSYEDFATKAKNDLSYVMYLSIEDNEANWKALFENYTRIIEWKDEILRTMSVEGAPQPQIGHNHEGLVVDTAEFGMIKLVNRRDFSSFNFRKHE